MHVVSVTKLSFVQQIVYHELFTYVSLWSRFNIQLNVSWYELAKVWNPCDWVSKANIALKSSSHLNSSVDETLATFQSDGKMLNIYLVPLILCEILQDVLRDVEKAFSTHWKPMSSDTVRCNILLNDTKSVSTKTALLTVTINMEKITLYIYITKRELCGQSMSNVYHFTYTNIVLIFNDQSSEKSLVHVLVEICLNIDNNFKCLQGVI